MAGEASHKAVVDESDGIIKWRKSGYRSIAGLGGRRSFLQSLRIVMGGRHRRGPKSVGSQDDPDSLVYMAVSL